MALDAGRGLRRRLGQGSPLHSSGAKSSPVRKLSTYAQVLGLAGWLTASFAAGAVGAYASATAAQFYGALVRPPWAPSASLFGPVWSVLFLLMGIAAWLVWRRHGFRAAPVALGLFVVQLLANALWTWLFFVWHRGAIAFAEIVLLWLLIAATTLAFGRLHRPAAVLLLPYLLWVGFATILTLSLWQLNPAILG